METIDPKTFLWGNVCALMGEEDPSLDRVARRTGVGRGNLQRMRDPEKGVEMRTLTAVAAGFRLQVWQLLVPGLQAHQLPQLSTAGPLSKEVMAGLAGADRDTVRRVDVAVRAMLDMPAAAPSARTPQPEDTPAPHSLAAVLVEAFEAVEGDALSKFRLLQELQRVMENWATEGPAPGRTPPPPGAAMPARKTLGGTQPAAARVARKHGPRR